MKKVLLILLIVTLLFTACDSVAQGVQDGMDAANAEDSSVETEAPEETENEPEDNDEPTDEPEEEPLSAFVGEGELGDYYVIIKDAIMSQDNDGQDCIVITCEWTNNSDDATSFLVAFSYKAFQNGIECSRGSLVEGVNVEDEMREIKGGASLEAQISFVLNDDVGDVELEITEVFNFDTNAPSIVKTFSLPL